MSQRPARRLARPPCRWTGTVRVASSRACGCSCSSWPSEPCSLFLPRAAERVRTLGHAAVHRCVPVTLVWPMPLRRASFCRARVRPTPTAVPTPRASRRPTISVRARLDISLVASRASTWKTTGSTAVPVLPVRHRKRASMGSAWMRGDSRLGGSGRAGVERVTSSADMPRASARAARDAHALTTAIHRYAARCEPSPIT